MVKYLDLTGLGHFFDKIKELFVTGVSYNATSKKLTFERNGGSYDIVDLSTVGGVTSFGTKTGAITVRSGSTTGGDVNFTMNSNELTGSVVGYSGLVSRIGTLESAGYVTQTALSGMGYVTGTALSGMSYVTQTALSGMGYLTANESITFTASGDVTGTASGTTSLTPTLTIGNGKVTNDKLKYSYIKIGTQSKNLGEEFNLSTLKTDLGISSAMLFKGTLGTGGTITSLPAAAAANEGYTYKVITDGTYASQAAKVGDVFISNGSSWVLVPSGDEPSGTVTSVTAGAGLAGGEITTSGTISLATANGTAATTANSWNNAKVDSSGNIQYYSYHPTTTAASAAAVKVGKDALGHVVIGNALTASDVGITVTSTSVSDGTNTFNKYTHPTATAAGAAAVKVGNDGLGHVVLGSALAYGDISGISSTSTGKGSITIGAVTVTNTDEYVHPDPGAAANYEGTSAKTVTLSTTASQTFNVSYAGFDSKGHATSFGTKTITLDASGLAASTHAHGNLASGGTITAQQTIATGDRIVVAKSSDKAITYSSISFDTTASGSAASKPVLGKTGAWVDVTPAGYAFSQADTQTLDTAVLNDAKAYTMTYVAANIGTITNAEIDTLFS